MHHSTGHQVGTVLVNVSVPGVTKETSRRKDFLGFVVLVDPSQQGSLAQGRHG